MRRFKLEFIRDTFGLLVEVAKTSHNHISAPFEGI
jgi:hypothetical protein